MEKRVWPKGLKSMAGASWILVILIAFATFSTVPTFLVGLVAFLCGGSLMGNYAHNRAEIDEFLKNK